MALGPVHPKAMPSSWQLSRSWVWQSRLPQSCKAVGDRHPHAQWILWANMTCFWGGCWMSRSKRPCWRGRSLEMSWARGSHRSPSLFRAEPHTHLSCLWVITESFGREKGSTGQGERKNQPCMGMGSWFLPIPTSLSAPLDKSLPSPGLLQL